MRELEAVRDVAAEIEDEAGVLERHGHGATADRIRAVARRFVEAVEDVAPRWVSLRSVERDVDLSRPTLRRRCKELEGQGRARKDESGRWEVRLDAAHELVQRAEGRLRRSGRPEIKGRTIEDLERESTRLALET